MEKNAKILVAGSKGMVGSAIVRNLKARGYENVTEASRETVDFTRQTDVYEYMEKLRPEYVFLAAAKVGGIMANKTHPADFILTNLQIQNNVIGAAYKSGGGR